jgi:hypothetical protein
MLAFLHLTRRRNPRARAKLARIRGVQSAVLAAALFGIAALRWKQPTPGTTRHLDRDHDRRNRGRKHPPRATITITITQ